MRPRRLGISNYHLFLRRQVEGRGDASAGRPPLTQFAGDPGAMNDLRALLEDSAVAPPDTPLTDSGVLEGIARLLDSGELLLLRDGPVHGGSATQPDSGPSSTPAGSPATAASAKSQTPENPSLPANTDSAAQASSLAAAASSGAPFCAH